MEPLSIPHAVVTTGLVGGTVAIHSAGSFILFWAFERQRSRALKPQRYAQLTIWLTWVVLALLFLHVLEVMLWAATYYQQGCFPDLRTSIYFSLVTYATVGYGDVVLPSGWRVFGAVEALVGVLMMSWSTAILLGCVQWVYTRLVERWGGQPPNARPS